MPKTKLIDNNRRSHAAKILAETSKKNKSIETNISVNKKSSAAIEGQYRIIRQDILKLRTDLARGYDLVKDWVGTKVSRRMVLRSK